MGTLQIRRGLAENLPTEAAAGEILFTTDTKKFYVGNGDGNALTEFNNAAQLTNFLAQKAEKEHTHTAENITDFATAVDERITAQKGQANGLATLDTSGKIPNAQIPNVFKEAAVVDNITARDALDAFEGLKTTMLHPKLQSTIIKKFSKDYLTVKTKSKKKLAN